MDNLANPASSARAKGLRRPLEPPPVVGWSGGRVGIIDQTLLPDRLVFLRLGRVEGVWETIKTLRVRGAPAIGVAAARGMCLGLKEAARSRSNRRRPPRRFP